MAVALLTVIIQSVIALATIGFLIYKYSTRNYDYWKKRGVPYPKPSPFLGNFGDVFFFRKPIGYFILNFYNQFKAPYFGIFVLNKPHLVVKSPELIKSILVKDFNYFQDRTIVSEEKCDPICSKFLLLAKNPEWKEIRTKTTPVFTTGKIKNMIQLINNVAEEMGTYIEKMSGKSSVEAKEVCAKYSTDVIASCAFGINAHCFESENAAFRVMGRKMFDFRLTTAMRHTFYFLAPGLVKLFRIPFIDSSVSEFMREVFWKTINQREQSQTKRNDLIDILIQIRKNNKPDDNIKFDGDTVVAQAGQFYAAGFETVSSTMSFTIYELALHTKIQNKVRAEIKDVVAKHASLTYEAVQEMKYLHMVVCETLRKYPVLPFLDRECAQEYKFPGTDLVLEKGTPVYISLFGLQYDPEYFPEPEKYDPERFSEENKNSIPPFCYLPFGEGPRICIGERFGLLATKIGLAQIILNFEIQRNSQTPVPIVYETKTILLSSDVGLPVTFKKIVSVTA